MGKLASRLQHPREAYLQELHAAVGTLGRQLGHSLLEDQVLVQHPQQGQKGLHHREAAPPHLQLPSSFLLAGRRPLGRLGRRGVFTCAEKA